MIGLTEWKTIWKEMEDGPKKDAYKKRMQELQAEREQYEDMT